MEKDRNKEVVISWLVAESDIHSLSDFFVSHVDASYISYGDIVCGRARGSEQWVPDLSEVILEELKDIASGASDKKRILTVHSEGDIVALGIVNLSLESHTPHAVIEDIIVHREHRGGGLGAQILEYLSNHLRELGVQTLFLESGIRNSRAHDFFGRCGFQPVSIVMRRTL